MPTLKHSYNGFNYNVDIDLHQNKLPVIQIESYKYPDKPTVLYHYYNMSQYSMDSLCEHYIYANHPFDFNDPFDCNRDLISFEKTSLEEIYALNKISKPDEIKRLFFSKKQEDTLLLHDLLKWLMYNVIYLKTGIYCMSSKKDSMEMWSYYTGHRGFVLEFDIQNLPSNRWGPFPINYTDKFEKIDYSIFKTLSFIYQSNIKSKCWDHEREWRLIFYGPNMMTVPFRHEPDAHNRKFYYDPKIIKHIILGFYFFEMNEYDTTLSNPKKRVVKLKKNITNKRRVLQYIISNNLAVSMVNLKRESSSDLGFRPIQLKMISSNKYEIKNID
jgi:hypothetical protein